MLHLISIELWIVGVIVESEDSLPYQRGIVRQVGENEIVLANILNGVIYNLKRATLEEMYKNRTIKFSVESLDFGDLKFFDLTEDEQREVNRRYKYIKALLEKGINKITDNSARAG